MKNSLENRLLELRAEYARGEGQLAQLDQRRAEVRDTLLRISGAIQVLEELLQAEAALGTVQPAELAELSQPGNGLCMWNASAASI
jgi:hypothetical protein